MREQGRAQAFVFGTWLTCAALLTLAAVALSTTAGFVLSFVLATL